MKKRLLRVTKIIGIFILILLVVLLTFIFIDERDTSVIEKYVKNENLPTIKADWQGTPVDEKGRFVNAEFPYLAKIKDILKWQLSPKSQKAEKQNDTGRLEVKDPTDFLNDTRDGLLWLGHAGFLIRLDGVNIIVDPAFGKPSFVKTFVDVPSPIDKLKQVDYLLISHDHRDHCDEESIKQITQKFPNVQMLGGLGMEDLYNDWKTPLNQVQTAGWYQQFSLGDEKVKISFVPIRHWARRGLFDTNKRLWGGYIIQGAGKTIYFGGDSGYGSHYKEVGELFPQIDYFLIGIGAYEPRWFMKPNHNSPQDAFQAFVDSKAKYMVPMHYGRFDLSDEPPSEPLRLLKEEVAKAKAEDKVKIISIYQNLDF